MLITKRNL